MRLLVANRGEIAARVIRSAQATGHWTIAVYSDVDIDAPHVALADEAVLIGPAAVRESYLSIERILDAAKRSGATAIHPGYGFLSENADFAEACEHAGITFVGPSADVIRLMGDKAAAKRRMAKAGVPLLPGYQDIEQDDDRLINEAGEIGFPLMVKAAAGGGGKGMRLVLNKAELSDAIAAARREALGAFGSDVLILERALLAPRHVEIQVLGDQHGKVLALGERDCSIQRRHQKVVEEAPSPALDAELRKAMSETAVTAATEIGYVGAGTLEFLLDPENGEFFFLEMNTRLQVEHPVTEMTTGLDLVDWQLRIAEGEPLPFEQADIELKGHAIEVRLYAEDPDYLPSSGRIERWEAPSGDGIRVDAGINEGYVVTPSYDPMLAKMIAHGATRDDARRRLITALKRTTLLGVTSNRAFLLGILNDPRFASGEFSTAFLADSAPEVTTAGNEHIAAAARVLAEGRKMRADERAPGLGGWTSRQSGVSVVHFAEQDAEREVRTTTRGGTTTVEVDGDETSETVKPRASIVLDDVRVLVAFPDLDVDLTDVTLAAPGSVAQRGSGVLTSPFHGTVSAVLTSVGAQVDIGDRLAVVEAMKMEHPIVADVAGVVRELPETGAQVAAGDQLIRVEPDEGESEEKS